MEETHELLARFGALREGATPDRHSEAIAVEFTHVGQCGLELFNLPLEP